MTDQLRAEVRQWLAENWADVVRLPLDVLKRWVRERNPDARATADTRVELRVKIEPQLKATVKELADVFGMTLGKVVTVALERWLAQLVGEDDSGDNGDG